MRDEMLEPTQDEQPDIYHWTQVKPQEASLNPLMLSDEGFTKEHNCLLSSESTRHSPYQIRLVKFDRSYVIAKLRKTVGLLVGDRVAVKKHFGFDSHNEASKVLDQVLDDLMEPCNDSQTTQR